MEDKKMKLKLNKYWYYEIINKPTKKELKEYYAKKYYQETSWNYKKKYSDSDLENIKLKFNEKYFVLSSILNKRKWKILDVWCWEWWGLRFFKNLWRNILWLDFSEEWIINQNKDLKRYTKSWNIYDMLENLEHGHGTKFDVIVLDNILEHVVDPKKLLDLCISRLAENWILIIQVPNDFSALQIDLLNKWLVNEKYRLRYPDHLSYFNKDSLINLLNECWLSCKFFMATSIIDFNLYNNNSNYIKNKNLWKSCYEQIKSIDNLFHSISLEKTVKFYQSLAELGLWRDLIWFFINK